MTLRARLALAVGVLLGVVVAGGWAIVAVVPRSQLHQVDRQLRSGIVPQAFALRDPGADPGADPGPGPEPRQAPTPADQPFAEVYVAMLATDGTRRVVVRPGGTTDGPEPALPTVTSAPGAEVDIVTVGSVGGSGRWRAVLLRAPSGGDRILVAVSLDEADATARQVQLTVGAVAAVLVLVLALGGWWVLRLGLRPIAEVTDVAGAITAGDRSRRVRVGRAGTEAGRLGQAINVMLDERQAGEDRLRRFVADASHELRTPVAAIRGFADLYRNGHLDEPGALADAMRRIGGESARMAGLVEDLLLLARLDEGRPLERARVDLSQVLRDAALDASATHPSRTVTTEVTDGLTVEADDARLRQVVANLVQNALVHAGPAAQVTVRGRRDGDRCVIEVTDDGVGLSARDVEHAFDRFWRADPARLRYANGSGLGLSIVRAITEASGGSVGLESATGRGTTVRVVLPAA